MAEKVQVGRQATTGEIVKAGKHQKGRLPKSGGDAPDDRAPPTQRPPACPLRPSVDGSPRIPPEIGVELGIRAPQASALPPPEGVTTRACGRSSPRERLRPAAALAASSMARLRSPRSPRSTRRCAWILPLVSAACCDEQRRSTTCGSATLRYELQTPKYNLPRAALMRYDFLNHQQL